jgi:hypothetical protein
MYSLPWRERRSGKKVGARPPRPRVWRRARRTLVGAKAAGGRAEFFFHKSMDAGGS